MAGFRRRSARRQAEPGWYRYKVGNIEVTVVTDGIDRFKLPDDITSPTPSRRR